ncbi:MAG: hypothetical protein IJS46_04070, partial [Kiritimatiellae bacterium]|nr:hypothetical protein [Kiritimatiellia bacterium]
MGTLLKVLNVFILVFAAAACFFAYGNFGKLKESAERAEKLKDAVISLGTTLEAAEPSFDGVANHTAWDIDDVSERPVDAPTTDDFWDSYLDQYELAANETLNLGRKRDQLGQLYSIDPASNKPRKGADGKNLTTGKGTMQDLLDDTVQRAKEQYSLLNKTRQQLIEVREKLDDVAEMLNSEKRARRDALAQIAQFRSAAEAVQAQLAQKDSLVAQANREKTDLEDQIADLRSV